MAAQAFTGSVPLKVVPDQSAKPVRLPPSKDAVLFLVSAFGYLLLLCVFVLVTGLIRVLGVGLSIPNSFFDDRDLLALFGWVGLTICGVSSIVVPSHFGAPIRPRYLARLHVVLANTGILGFFLFSILLPGSALGEVFLLVTAGSFLLFGSAILATIAPYLGPAFGHPFQGR